MRRSLIFLFFILVIVIAILSGCTTTINPYPASTPTPQVVYVTVTVPVTEQKQVETPIQVIIVPPGDWSIQVQVQSNGFTPDPQIITTITGGQGLNLYQRVDVIITRSDGKVENGNILKPLKVGDSVSLAGTTKPGCSDRAVVWATDPRGDKVKIFDDCVPFRTYN